MFAEFKFMLINLFELIFPNKGEDYVTIFELCKLALL